MSPVSNVSAKYAAVFGTNPFFILPAQDLSQNKEEERLSREKIIAERAEKRRLAVERKRREQEEQKRQAQEQQECMERMKEEMQQEQQRRIEEIRLVEVKKAYGS